MERLVEIDNLCAWPNLTLVPGGPASATILWPTDPPTVGGTFPSVLGDDKPLEPGGGGHAIRKKRREHA